MPKRGGAWEEEETLNLLDAIDDVLPINPEEWEQVRALHNERYEWHRRTTKTLIRIFGELARTTEPTGSPNIPPAVKLAKDIRERIKAKTDGTTGSPDDDSDSKDEDGDEEGELPLVPHNVELPLEDSFEGGDGDFLQGGNARGVPEVVVAASRAPAPGHAVAGGSSSAAAAAASAAAVAAKKVGKSNKRSGASPKLLSQLQSMKKAPLSSK